MSIKKYIFTSYIPGSTVDEDFIQILENYGNINNAELKIGLTGALSKSDKGLVSSRVIPYLITENFKINSNLLYLNLEVTPTSLDPISGMDAIANDKGSLIIASPRHRFRSIARSLKHNKSPRGIWCTGSVSNACYGFNKSGLKAEGIHKKGAIVITVKDDEIFHIRQLSLGKQGVYDLNSLYTKHTLTMAKSANPSAVVLGDIHPPFIDTNVLVKTTYLLKKLQPKHIVYHDIFDAVSISHHVEGKNITKVEIHNTVPGLLSEIETTSSVLHLLINSVKKAKHVVVRSNHDEHLDRYLDEARYVKDYSNKQLAVELVNAKLKGKNPLEFALTRFNSVLNKLLFLNRDDKYSVAGIECSNHGDYGANGGKGSSAHHGLAFSGKVVTGHSHTPEIGIYGNYVSGTMTYLTLPYTNDSGTSGWLNTHTVIYPDGNMTHVHLIDTKK